MNYRTAENPGDVSMSASRLFAILAAASFTELRPRCVQRAVVRVGM